MSDNIIAVNIGSYRAHRGVAFAHLQQIGIANVEIPVPKPEELDDVLATLRSHGLTATSLNCPCDLTEPLEAMEERLQIGQRMEVPLFFISAKAGDLPKPEAYGRLRERADLAERYGITLSLETHPDLGENAGEARATLHAVEHPHLRWNLDTANLYYYNANIDAVEQTVRGLDLIGSVHLKDTNGGYKAWWFPALGQGIVDFPAVFQTLNGHGFYGPFTMELEGIQGETLDEAGVSARVQDSLAYLQDLGLA
jgi:L-ribulose-5-phosphate 3-epimerase